MTRNRRGNDELWAITSYFNPVGYKRRLANYRVFRKHFPLPLVTAELSFGDSFELCDDDAEVLIQLKSETVLWQKERLLEIALQAVPAACRKVMWIDCDVIFERDGWPERVCQGLEEVPVLQPFSEVQDLGPDALPGSGAGIPIGTARSFALAAETAAPGTNIFRHRPPSVGQRTDAVAGFSWCFRRELLERHGLYSGGILGGGDRALACATCGQLEAASRNWKMNDRQRRHYREWAEPFHAEVRSEVGFVDGTIHHLWHGALEHRRYRERHEGLRRFDFDPYTDIALDDRGCWRWNSEKPELHAYVANHFLARREDGLPCGSAASGEFA